MCSHVSTNHFHLPQIDKESKEVMMQLFISLIVYFRCSWTTLRWVVSANFDSWGDIFCSWKSLDRLRSGAPAKAMPSLHGLQLMLSCSPGQGRACMFLWEPLALLWWMLKNSILQTLELHVAQRGLHLI